MSLLKFDTTFELTEDHLKLLKQMGPSFAWREDDGYEGTPEVNHKRPYGNSDIIGDIVEALELLSPEDIRDLLDEGDDFPEEIQDEARRIHAEMATALQVVLFTQSFVPGVYRANQFLHNWERECSS